MESTVQASSKSDASVPGLLSQFLSAEDVKYLDRRGFPSPERVRAMRTGVHRARLRGGSTEFAEHRAYSNGDDVKRLDWRIVGRSDRLEIKLYEDPSILGNVMLLDASGSMSFGDSTRSKFAYGCSIVAFLSKLLLADRDPVGLRIAGGDSELPFLPPSGGSSQLAQILNQLVSLKPHGDSGLAEQVRFLAKHMRNSSRVFIVTDAFMDLSSLETELELLVRRGHRFHILNTMAPEEVHLNYRQPLRFSSLESAERIDANPQHIIEDYLAAMRKHVDRLRSICMRYRAGYEPMVTDKPVGRSLADYVRRHSERKR